jgi:hypothetical protein
MSVQNCGDFAGIVTGYFDCICHLVLGAAYGQSDLAKLLQCCPPDPRGGLFSRFPRCDCADVGVEIGNLWILTHDIPAREIVPDAIASMQQVVSLNQDVRIPSSDKLVRAVSNTGTAVKTLSKLFYNIGPIGA